MKPDSLIPPSNHQVSYNTFSRRRFSSHLAQLYKLKRPARSLPPLNLNDKSFLNNTIDVNTSKTSHIPESIRNQPENSIIPPIKDLIVHPVAKRFYFSRQTTPSRAYIRQRGQEHLAKKYPKLLHRSADPNLSDEIEHLNRPMLDKSRIRQKNQNFADKILKSIESPRMEPNVVYSIEDFELKKGLNGSFLAPKENSVKDEIPFSKRTPRRDLKLKLNNKTTQTNLDESKNYSPRPSFREYVASEIRRLSREPIMTKGYTPRRIGPIASQLESKLILADLNRVSKNQNQPPRRKFVARIEPLNLSALEGNTMSPRRDLDSTDVSKANSRSTINKVAPFNLSKIGSRKNSDFHNQIFYFPAEQLTHSTIESPRRLTKRSPSRIPSNQSLNQSLIRETEERQLVTDTLEQVYPTARSQKRDARSLMPLNKIFGQRTMLL
mgnify:FL=1